MSDQLQMIENIRKRVSETQEAADEVGRDNHNLRVLLLEAKLAIEYLHRLYAPTGSSNTALTRIEEALAE